MIAQESLAVDWRLAILAAERRYNFSHGREPVVFDWHSAAKARDYILDCNRLHLMYTQSGGPPSVQRVVREMFHEIAKSS